MGAFKFVDTSSWVGIACFVLILYIVQKTLRSGLRDPRMPPGPPTLPIIGNLHQIPKTNLHKMFGQWADQYGDVFSLMVGPTPMIVLRDRKAIYSLCDKKGEIYSDRPVGHVSELLFHGDHISQTQMDSVWREKRRAVAHNLSPKRLDEQHFRVQEAEATVLMNDLLTSPHDFYNHIKRYTASVASVITAGHRGPTYESFWAHAVYDVLETAGAVMEPGVNPPVDEFPFLKWIPQSIYPWKARVLVARDKMDSTWGKARSIIDERRRRGDHRESIVDALLDEYEQKDFPFSQHGFNNLLGELIEGAADTTASQILTLILAFAKWPEVQRKAQVEIDAVCGSSRSPLWSDFDSLPYINAIIKEGMRWRPVAPTGIPHKVRRDDYYDGMFIPKGSIIFLASWGLHHDEKFYFDHEKFDPDSWNLHHYGYGAGRRICPGIHLAERNMWRIAAKLLWAFEFSEPHNLVTGQTKSIDSNAYSAGLIQAPLPYEVTITPRSPDHIAIIRKEQHSALEFLGAFE